MPLAVEMVCEYFVSGKNLNSAEIVLIFIVNLNCNFYFLAYLLSLVYVQSQYLAAVCWGYMMLMMMQPGTHEMKWNVTSGLHSNMQSSCTSVSTGLHLHTLLMSFVRWQMSRLVSDSVPVHCHHWLSATPDCPPSETELFRSPLLMSGTVCLILSLLHLP